MSGALSLYLPFRKVNLGGCFTFPFNSFSNAFLFFAIIIVSLNVFILSMRYFLYPFVVACLPSFFLYFLLRVNSYWSTWFHPHQVSMPVQLLCFPICLKCLISIVFIWLLYFICNTQISLAYRIVGITIVLRALRIYIDRD